MVMPFLSPVAVVTCVTSPRAATFNHLSVLQNQCLLIVEKVTSLYHQEEISATHDVTRPTDKGGAPLRSRSTIFIHITHKY